MASKQSAAKERLKLDRIQEAMIPLVGISAFADWMKLIGELKDEAVAFSVESDTVKSERESLAVRGEIRAYMNLESIYRGQLEQQAALAEQQAEQRQAQ